MRLGVRDVARRLGVSESTVFKWVDHRELPATQIDGQFRFSPAAVYEWAASQGIPVRGNLFEDNPDPRSPLPLTQALRKAGIVTGLHGADRAAILRAAVERLRLPPHADRAVILDMLLARERLGSTGIGEGFAVPHVRNPIVLRVAEPMVTLFLLDQPIDFGSGDRKPVHSLFLMITPTMQSHLLVLSRLGGVLQDAGVREVIRRRAPAAAILAEIERCEAGIARPPEDI
jgi:PTS system nitrogen regulatory IIA component